MASARDIAIAIRDYAQTTNTFPDYIDRRDIEVLMELETLWALEQQSLTFAREDDEDWYRLQYWLEDLAAVLADLGDYA